MPKKPTNYLSTPGSSTTLFLKYHAKREGLEIGFTSKEVYEYEKVPESLWQSYYEEVTGGESSGKFFNRHIKDKYEYTRIT